MTVTDIIPAGTSYLAGSIGVSQSLGTLIVALPQITWTGTVTEAMPFQIFFQVRVEESLPVLIENIARLQLAGDANTYDLQTIVIANAYRVYLPLILQRW
jgi:hypothetical protein